MRADPAVFRRADRAWQGDDLAVRRIGDCLAPRGVDEAVYEGEHLARSLT
jgi:hypothetical protein